MFDLSNRQETPGVIVDQFDSTQARLREYLFKSHDDRGYPLDKFVDVVYSPNHYTGSGTLVWTVGADDQITLGYRTTGDRYRIDFSIETTSVAGAGNLLFIAYPGIAMPVRFHTNAIWINDNGAQALGFAIVVPGSPVLRIARFDGANWAGAANTTYVRGHLEYSITPPR